jgi:HAD superfamily hydrolase (TIGR01509 family)
MIFDAPGRRPAAVLWDMDGTLVDTEPFWVDAEFALIAEHGGVWDERHAAELVGNSLIESARYIRRHSGIDLEPEMIVENLIDRVVERVRGEIPWRPGAHELLTELGDLGVPCALVTMSYRRLAHEVVAALPPRTFAAVVAGDDVTHSKPHPEPYLLAARRLGVPPEDCIAIEDSPPGLASAVAAGVPTLGVEYLVPLTDGPGRELVSSLVGITAEDLGELARPCRDRARVG